MNNHEVVNRWIQGKSEQGKSNNIFFEGKDIYSYGYHFKMATIINDNIVLLNDTTYSVTTSKHQGMVATCALKNNYKIYKVVSYDNHKENINNYIDKINENKGLAKRARKYKEFYNNKTKELELELKDYKKLFNIK